jgi:uncharacterized iron-regulated membrane protein
MWWDLTVTVNVWYLAACIALLIFSCWFAVRIGKALRWANGEDIESTTWEQAQRHGPTDFGPHALGSDDYMTWRTTYAPAPDAATESQRLSLIDADEAIAITEQKGRACP